MHYTKPPSPTDPTLDDLHYDGENAKTTTVAQVLRYFDYLIGLHGSGKYFTLPEIQELFEEQDIRAARKASMPMETIH